MEIDNIYKDMKLGSYLFDFLDYPKSNGLFSVENKKVLENLKMNGTVK